MNYGAFVFEPEFLTQAEIANAVALAGEFRERKRPVHEAGKFSDLQWFQVPLDESWPVAKKILARLGASKPEILVFYYLEPGAKIHPHRDLTGAALNNRIRFHVPVVTNPGVEFVVDGERVRMTPGDLWCLDTSYLHSVANTGDETRVHIVVECKINPQLEAELPRNLKTRLHTLAFTAAMSGVIAKSLLVNSFRDPAFLRQQIAHGLLFIGWRVLGIGRPRQF